MTHIVSPQVPPRLGQTPSHSTAPPTLLRLREFLYGLLVLPALVHGVQNFKTKPEAENAASQNTGLTLDLILPNQVRLRAVNKTIHFKVHTTPLPKTHTFSRYTHTRYTGRSFFSVFSRDLAPSM